MRADTRWHIIKPTVIEVDNPDADYNEFSAFAFTEDVKHRCQAVLPAPAPRPQDVMDVIMAENCAYYPEKFMQDQWKHLLQHVDNKKVPRCNRYKINVADVYHFYVMIYYFGLVRLPAKRDYWKIADLDIMPSHPICTVRNMSYKKFQFIWNHISAVPPDSADQPAAVNATQPAAAAAAAAVASATEASAAASATAWPDEDSDDEDSLPDAVDPSDDEYSDGEEDSDDDDDGFGFDRKASPYIKQFNRGTKTLFRFPSSNVVIDEMMTRFKGRSRDTYRMKSKPIKEGFKYFAIADSECTFVWHLVPYGRVNTRVGIIDTVKALVDTLPEPDKHNYLVSMDNYFTYDRAVDYVVDKGMHVVGTAKVKRGWPPKPLADIDESRFNFLHHTRSNSGKFNICRWVDNGVVLVVSSCHDPHATVTKQRKRPRVTQNNRANVKQVWGSDWVREIEIPAAVDDYNDGKTGVDGTDQLISYYAPDLRMRRTWMPHWLHTVNASRANSFSHHREYCGPHALSSKSHLLGWIRCMMQRAKRLDAGYASRGAMDHAPSPSPSTKRKRVSSKYPTLPDQRFDESRQHVCVLSKIQRACMFCRFKRAWKKVMRIDSDDLPKISRPRTMCLGCMVHLCRKCFAIYHTIDNPDWEKMIPPTR